MRGRVPRVGPGKLGWASKSTIRLARAPVSPCPHCGRTTKTVQGVCADCWGSKEGRQFWVRHRQGSGAFLEGFLRLNGLEVVLLGAVVSSIPAAILLVAWISG